MLVGDHLLRGSTAFGSLLVRPSSYRGIKHIYGVSVGSLPFLSLHVLGPVD